MLYPHSKNKQRLTSRIQQVLLIVLLALISACTNQPLDGLLGEDTPPAEENVAPFYLETKADGTGERITSAQVRLNESLKVYGIKRGSQGEFVENVEVSWVLNGSIGQLDILLGGKNARFTALQLGSGEIKATAQGVTQTLLIEVVTNPTPPDPVSLTANALGQNSVQLNWISGGGTTAGYRIAYRSGLFPPLDCTQGSLINENQISGTSHTISGLSPGTLYSFRVCSINNQTPIDVSEGTYVKERTDEASPPDPISFAVTTYSSSVINLSWGSGGGTTAGYRLAYSTGAAPADCSSGTQISEHLINGTSHTVSGLSPSTNYHFRLCAINNGNPIQESTGMTLSQVTLNPPPPNPTGLAATVNSKSSITLSWTSGGGSTVDFRISYFSGTLAPENCETGNKIEATDITGTSHTLTGLVEATEYSFRVCAVDGQSPPVHSSGITVTAMTHYDVPPDPIMVQGKSTWVEDITAYSATVYAQAPMGSTSKKVAIAYQANSPPPDCETGTISYINDAFHTVSPSKELDGLTQGTTYGVRLCLRNENSPYQDSPGVTFSFTTFDGATPPAPTGVNPSEIKATTTTFSWTSGGGSTANFALYAQQGSTALNATICTSSVRKLTSTTSYEFKDLDKQTEYSGIICALNQHGEPSPAVNFSFTTIDYQSWPDPTGVTVTSQSHSDLEMTLTFPPNIYSAQIAVSTGSTPPTGCENGDKANMNYSTNTTGPHSIDIKNLATNTTYAFRVCSETEEGEFSPGVTLTAATSSTEIPAPEPLNFTAQALSDSGVEFNWSSGGGKTEDFKLVYSTGGTPNVKCASGTELGATSITKYTTKYTKTGLTPGQTYYFRLCSLSDDSVPVYSDGPTATVTLSAGGAAPADPLNLTAETLSDTEIQVSWDDPGGTAGFYIAYAEGYIYPASCVHSPYIKSSEITGTTHTLSNLKSGEEYSIRVCSVNASDTHSSGVTTRAYTYLSPSQPIVMSRTHDSGSGNYLYLEVAGDIDGDGVHDIIDVNTYTYDKLALAQNFLHQNLWTSNEVLNDYFQVGDVNNDGIVDIATGFNSISNLGGVVRVLSGLDGLVLMQISGKAHQRLGSHVFPLNDRDNDGLKEIIVTSYYAREGSEGEYEVKSGLYLASLADGTILNWTDRSTTVTSSSYPSSKGYSLGDITGDNIDDFIIYQQNFPLSRYEVYNGANLNLIHSADLGSNVNLSHGIRGDFNGDGKNDVVLVYEESSETYLEVLSGANLARIFRIPFGGGGNKDRVALAPDVNGDGTPDFLIASSDYDGYSGEATGIIKIISGVDGFVVNSLEGPNQDGHFGRYISYIGDYNGNGFPDICVTAYYQTGSALEPRTYIMSAPDLQVVNTIRGHQLPCGASVGDLNGDGADEFMSGFGNQNYIIWGMPNL